MNKNHKPATTDMPANVDAERACLGAILLNNETIVQAEVLDWQEFSLDSHRVIFRAMLALSKKQEPIDFVTLKTELGGKHGVDAVGGEGYVTSLTDGLPRVKNIEQYVRMVKEAAQRRQFIMICQSAIQEAYESGDKTEQLIQEADKKLCDIQGKIGKGPRLACEVVSEIREEFARVRAIDAEREAIGIRTGVKSLDSAILGYHKGEMVLIGGETSHGKSVLMRQGVQAQIADGGRPLVFTFEVYGRQFLTNMLSPFLTIPREKLRDFRQLDDMPKVLGKRSEVQELETGLAEIKNWKLWIYDDSRNNHIDTICSTARAAIRRHGVDSIWLDQISLVRGTGENKTGEVEYISERLVSLASSENIPVIALSQFNRDRDRQSGKREPRKGDIKQAARLEEDAHCEIFVWEEEPKKHWLIVAKQRNGALAKLPVTLDRALLWFEDGHRYNGNDK